MTRSSDRSEEPGQQCRRQMVRTQARAAAAASSAVNPVSSSCGSAAARPKECDRAEREYVRAVLECYLWLPGTADATSRRDRACARALFLRGVPLEVVRAAMVVAVARRTFRRGEPLKRVRAVHFFLPVIDELLEEPCAPGYVDYLEQRLRPLAAQKALRGDVSRFGTSGPAER